MNNTCSISSCSYNLNLETQIWTYWIQCELPDHVAGFVNNETFGKWMNIMLFASNQQDIIIWHALQNINHIYVLGLCLYECMWKTTMLPYRNNSIVWRVSLIIFFLWWTKKAHKSRVYTYYGMASSLEWRRLALEKEKNKKIRKWAKLKRYNKQRQNSHVTHRT